MVKRQQFTAEFKREAVRQMRAGDKPIAQLSRELGVPRNRLYKWSQAVQTHGEQEAFPGIWPTLARAGRANAIATRPGAGRAGA